MEEIKPGVYKHYKGRFYKVYGLGEFDKPKESDVFIGTGCHSEDLSEVRIYKREDDFILEGEFDNKLAHVVYQACYYHPEYGNKAFWIRPEKMFLDEVESDKGRVARFQHMGSLEDIEKLENI